MTSADLKFVPQAKAFAVDGEKNPSIPTTSTTAMNLATGFPSVYSKPLAEGGKLIQRKEMNTLFYQLMLFQNFLQNGGYITWNADVMNGIGGYPNGAVLSLIDSVTGAETRIQSCVDNNYLQPTAESIGAKYRVNTSTVPHTYTKDEGGNVIWRYVLSSGLIGSQSRVDVKDYGSNITGTGERGWYSGAYTMPFDGFLKVFFYWDCNGNDQAAMQILKENGELLSEQICCPPGETSQSYWKHYTFELPLKKGMTIRFRATENEFIENFGCLKFWAFSFV